MVTSPSSHAATGASSRFLALELVRATEAAALAAARWMGRGDKESADHAAVEAMRAQLDRTAIRGRVVIGEGELDAAPRIDPGEEVGRRSPGDISVDLAVDPLEGTAVTAKGGPNALSVAAFSEPGCLLHAPDTYMRKIAVGPACVGAVDLEASTEDNLRRIAEATRMPMSELTVCILDRPRHDALVAEVRGVGARIRLIPDGDVSGAIAAAAPSSSVDVLMGIGGAPEGVLAAAAIRALGGDFQGRLLFHEPAARDRAVAMGLEAPDAVLGLTDLARGDVVFAATGVTDGDLLDGIRFHATGATSSSVVMRSATGTIRWIEAHHDFHRGRAFPAQ